MILQTIKQIAIGIFCLVAIAFSSLSLFASSLVAFPQPTALAAMEEQVEKATKEAEEKAAQIKKTVENKSEEVIEDVKETAEKANSEDKDNDENLIDKVKSLLTGE